MYNTLFIVKYNDIEKELINNNKNEDANEESYQEQDIIDICDKLYRDELCSVFYAENIMDDKIDAGISDIIKVVSINAPFVSMMNEFKQMYYDEYYNEYYKELDNINDNKLSQLLQTCDTMIMLKLFSKSVFYITHKCICQQLNLGYIDEQLLSELKQVVIQCIYGES